VLRCISVCSMIVGLSVSAMTGLGDAIVTSIFQHDNQVRHTVVFAFGMIMLTLVRYYSGFAFSNIKDIPLSTALLISSLPPPK